MIYEDDTIDIVLKKISKHCSDYKEDYKYIYTTYQDEMNENKDHGFNYKDQELLEIRNLIGDKLCDIVDHNNDIEFNILENLYEKNIENLDIKDEWINFLNFSNFVDIHDLEDIDFEKIKECGEVSSFKNNVIDRYWYLLQTENLKDIIGKNSKKHAEFTQQNNKLDTYSIGNHVINLHVINLHNETNIPCIETSIEFLKNTKKQTKNVTVEVFINYLQNLN